jgi:hypothetical protein
MKGAHEVTERERKEDALRRESEERRAANPRIDARGRSRDDFEADAGRRRTSRSADPALEERGTSWTSVVLGWLTALGAGLILSGVVGAIVGAILGGAGDPAAAATEGGASGLIGLLITLLLAFLIGGYVAGRMASRQGIKHGLLVPLLALVVTVVLAGVGTLIGASFIENLSGVTLPALPQDTPQNLGALLTVSGILALLMPFLGGALGGAWGARTGRHRP